MFTSDIMWVRAPCCSWRILAVTCACVDRSQTCIVSACPWLEKIGLCCYSHKLVYINDKKKLCYGTVFHRSKDVYFRGNVSQSTVLFLKALTAICHVWSQTCVTSVCQWDEKNWTVLLCFKECRMCASEVLMRQKTVLFLKDPPVHIWVGCRQASTPHMN